MRRLNTGLIIGVFVTFLAHAVMGGMKIAGANTDALKMIAWICIGLIVAHIITSSILTFQAVIAMRKTHTSYWRYNKLFWIRRISGLAVLIPLIMHLMIFRGQEDGGAYRLMAFTSGRLISQLFLVAAIALHVLTNIRPLMITLGTNDHKAYIVDLLFVISVILLLMGVAFVIYYIRWMSY